MDVLAAIFGTILLMLGISIFVFKKAADAVALDAKAYYDRVGRIWLIGGLIQWKIRKLYKEFGENVFDKETPEEKEKAMRPHIERDLQKRRREQRKQNFKQGD